jgi:iron complex transport system permease protein
MARPLARAAPIQRRRRAATALVLIGGALGLAIVACSGRGALPIAPLEVLAVLAGKLGLQLPVQVPADHAAILWQVRLPRVILAVGLGGGLAAAGVAFQGLLRNPLADPSFLGVSSGAALAVAATIVAGGALPTRLSPEWSALLLPAAGFAGALGATLLLFFLAETRGGRGPVAVILCGVALAALGGAGVGLFTFRASDPQLRSITFWTLGSLGGATWRTLACVAPILALGLTLCALASRSLDGLALGERDAHHLGLSVARVRRLVLVAVALLVGAATAVAGVLGFVGLVAPHVVRMWIGPRHGPLLCGATLLGALLLLVADLVARTVAAPAELPIGILTALLGAPVLLGMVLRARAPGRAS